MPVEFSTARNGEEICQVDGIFLHSKYNPSQEAMRWIQNVQSDFTPQTVIVLGACIPYCAEYIKERFPKARIILIQYDKAFARFTSLGFDSFFIDDSTDSVTVSEALFDLLGEEMATKTLVISYLPSEKAFSQKAYVALHGVQGYIKKSLDVIGTRVYFSKKSIRR